MKTILVTGAAGYIGSHTCLALLEAGYKVIALDNLCNSDKESLNRVMKITGAGPRELKFHHGDVRVENDVCSAMFNHRPDAVIHFAGLKSVNESVDCPIEYYDNNVNGTVTLLRVMETMRVRRIVFSSSATVYDANFCDMNGISETGRINPINPYGRSKLMVEDILRDIAASNFEWAIPILRYFNPVGAHPSGEIGEDPQGIPNNLAPYITGVMAKRYERVKIFGNDYPTPDGTGVRDYIHVMDLANAHLAALQWSFDCYGAREYNLGTGEGTSVLEMIRAFEAVSGGTIPFIYAPRRAGDVARCLANPIKARNELGWKAEFGLEEMCRDAWNWQQKNPGGYE